MILRSVSFRQTSFKHG